MTVYTEEGVEEEEGEEGGQSMGGDATPAAQLRRKNSNELVIHETSIQSIYSRRLEDAKARKER